MTRTVFCKKYQEELEGLERPPFPGSAGEDIYQHVSQKAWQEWLNQQTMLINEKHLNVLDPKAKSFLSEQRERFLTNQDHEKVEGYVPPAQNSSKQND